MPACQKCKAHYPNRVTIDGRVRNLHSRRFCLVCSPFGAKNRRDLTRSGLARSVGESKTCPACEKRKPASAFYSRRGHGLSCYCRECAKLYDLERTRKFKQQCIEYLGSQCAVCGYSRCIGALEFHHNDPSEKEFGISQRSTQVFSTRVRRELDKCTLLCANCHRELHAGLCDLPEKDAVVSARIAQTERAQAS